MIPVKIFLIRHGNTFEAGQTPVMVGKRTDLPLTAQGLEQADLMAKHLVEQDIKIDKLYCGSLCRQQQTARAIQSHYPHLQQNFIPALDELDYGQWEGLTPHDVEQQWPQDYKNWNTLAEIPDQFNATEKNKKQHLLNWIEQAKTTLAGQTVVVCTSQGVIKLLLSLFPNLYQAKTLEDYKVKTGHFCEVNLHETLEIVKWNYNPKRLEDLPLTSHS